MTLRATEGRPRLSLRDGQLRPHIEVMHLDLSDEEAAALTQERHHLVESDRYPLSSAYPHLDNDPGQTRSAGAGAGTAATAECRRSAWCWARLVATLKARGSREIGK